MITLTLASGTGIRSGSVTLALAIASTGGDRCASVQWSFGHTSDVTLTSVALGSVAVSASKSLSRSGDLCVIWSSNQNVIADGTLITATFSIAANPSTGSIPISITGVVASDPDANPLTASGVSGTVTVDTPVLTCPVGGNTAVVNTPYTATLVASGGVPSYTYSIIG